jgi:hypothetical protein
MSSKFTERDDFAVGHDKDEDEIYWTFKQCVDKIATTCWNKRVKLPTPDFAWDTFVLICCTLDAEEFGYNFHLYFYHFNRRYLQQPIDWSYIRERLRKRQPDAFPSALLGFLESTDLAHVGFSVKHVIRMGKAVRAWDKVKGKSPSAYDQVVDQINGSIDLGIEAIWNAAKTRLKIAFVDSGLQKYCYENEIYLAELPLWHSAALLFMIHEYQRELIKLRNVVIDLVAGEKITNDELRKFVAKMSELGLKDELLMVRLRIYLT